MNPSPTSNATIRRDLILIAIGAAALVYSALRASLLSMTHDEASTYLNYIDMPLWECFANPECWGTANNHWLNSLLMQWSTAIFGTGEWAVRFPNVAGHALYICCSALLIRQVSPSILLSATAMAMFNLNPYLLDFFSLARGYGMNISFTMVSLYFIVRYLRLWGHRDLHWGFVFAMLAVLSNFVGLVYYTALCVLTPVFLYLRHGRDIGWEVTERTLIFPLSLTVILALFLFRPIMWLNQSGEFNFGVQTIQEMFRSLIDCGVYDQFYLTSKYTVPVAFLLYCACMLVSMVYISFRYLRDPDRYSSGFPAVLMFITLIFVLVLNHTLTGSLFPASRKALIFIPMSVLVVFFGLVALKERYPRAAMILSAAFLVCVVYHGLRSANLSYCREWQYDKDTKTAVLDVSHTAIAPDSVRLGVNWLFHHTTHFYIRTKHLRIPIPVYEKELHPDSSNQFYYILKPESTVLGERYDIWRQYDEGVMMQRVDPSLVPLPPE